MFRAQILISTFLFFAARVFAESAEKDVVESAYQAGHREAVKDLRDNRLIIETYGLPGPWSGEYARVLLEKYQIQLKTVAGCIVDDKIVGHARGYNEVSTAEIERRFGHDLLETVASEVQKRWNETRPR